MMLLIFINRFSSPQQYWGFPLVSIIAIQKRRYCDACRVSIEHVEFTGSYTFRRPTALAEEVAAPTPQAIDRTWPLSWCMDVSWNNWRHIGSTNNSLRFAARDITIRFIFSVQFNMHTPIVTGNFSQYFNQRDILTRKNCNRFFDPSPQEGINKNVFITLRSIMYNKRVIWRMIRRCWQWRLYFMHGASADRIIHMLLLQEFQPCIRTNKSYSIFLS